MTKFVYATLLIYDIEATLTANATQDSYGVQGSPTWVTLEDMRVETIAILGIGVNPKDLPPELLSRVCELADEWLEYSAWEAL